MIPKKYGIRFGTRHATQTIFVPTKGAAYRIARAIDKSNIGTVIIINHPGDLPVILPYKVRYHVI